MASTSNEETHVERPFFPAMKWKLQKNFTQWEECKSEPKSNTVTKDSDHQARVSCQFLFPQNSYFCYWTKQICLIWQCHAKLIACRTLSLHTVRNKNSSKQKVSFKLNVCRGLCKTHDRATWYQFEGQLSQSWWKAWFCKHFTLTTKLLMALKHSTVWLFFISSHVCYTLLRK